MQLTCPTKTLSWSDITKKRLNFIYLKLPNYRLIKRRDFIMPKIFGHNVRTFVGLHWTQANASWSISNVLLLLIGVVQKLMMRFRWQYGFNLLWLSICLLVLIIIHRHVFWIILWLEYKGPSLIKFSMIMKSKLGLRRRQEIIQREFYFELQHYCIVSFKM